jgi:uncharacterized protein (TIGR00661 family)
MGLPLMCFNHQQVLTHTLYTVPRRYSWDAWVARLVINTVMPGNAEHVLLSSFFYPPLRHPDRTTLVSPILRKAVQEVEPREGEHVLVYHNDPTGITGLLEALGGVPETKFVAYNFAAPADATSRLPNVEFKPAQVEGFLDDLASARAVVSTAGFTLISEALYLGKPMLLMPNGGLFEQTLNALYLEREGFGEAIMHRLPTAEDLRGFLRRSHRYAVPGPERMRCGNSEAVACIERVLAGLGAEARASVPAA